MARQKLIYKIMTTSDWHRMQADGLYRGSADDMRDGFVHFSAPGQVAGTFRKYFQGRGDLVLLHVQSHLLGDHLRWEPSRGGDLFPHLYAPLPLSAVATATSIGEDAETVLASLSEDAA